MRVGDEGSSDGGALVSKRMSLWSAPDMAAALERHNLRWYGDRGSGELSHTLMCVRVEDGARVVVKFDDDHSRLAEQVLVLRRWHEMGFAPEVAAFEPGLCVLERVAAVPLHWAVGSGVALVEMVAHVLSESWDVRDVSVSSAPFWWVFDVCAGRLRDFSGRRPDLPSGLFDPELFDRARCLLFELRQGQVTGLCHGDPVPGNVLGDGRGRVWLIDPLAHYDSLLCNVVHWASRVDGGLNSSLIAVRACAEIGVVFDRLELEGWLAFHAISPLVARVVRGENVPLELLRLLAPLL